MSRPYLLTMTATVLIALSATPRAEAQLSLGGVYDTQGDYRQRANQFMFMNRNIEGMQARRIKDRSFLFSQTLGGTRSFHMDPLILNPQYGLLQGTYGPTDFAGWSVRSRQLLRIDSQIANALMNTPRASDFQVNPTLDWTDEEIIEAMRGSAPSTSLALADAPPATKPASYLESTLAARAESSYREGSESFRNSVTEKDNAKRSALLSEARHKFDLMTQIEPDQPAGFFACAIVAQYYGNLNTAVINIELGLKRAKTLDEMRIKRSDFFANEADWQRLLDRMNLETRSSEDPGIHLIWAYYSFLNGDMPTAVAAAENVEKRLKSLAEATAGRRDESTTDMNRRIEEIARFRKLLGEAMRAPAGGQAS